MYPDFNYHGLVAVFDLDDTLAFEKDYCRSGFRFAADWLASHYPQLENPREVENVMGRALDGMNPHYDALEEWITRKGIEPREVMPALVSAVHSHVPDSLYALKPDALGQLESFLRAGVRMALVTDGRSNTQRAKIRALGLDKYFAPDLIFISGERGHDKYEPNNFMEIVRYFPEAKGFFYAGDNPEKDFRHPNLLGWTTFCVIDPRHRNLFSQEDRPWPDAPDHKIVSLTEIPSLI